MIKTIQTKLFLSCWSDYFNTTNKLELIEHLKQEYNQVRSDSYKTPLGYWELLEPFFKKIDLNQYIIIDPFIYGESGENFLKDYITSKGGEFKSYKQDFFQYNNKFLNNLERVRKKKVLFITNPPFKKFRDYFNHFKELNRPVIFLIPHEKINNTKSVYQFLNLNKIHTEKRFIQGETNFLKYDFTSLELYYKKPNIRNLCLVSIDFNKCNKFKNVLKSYTEKCIEYPKPCNNYKTEKEQLNQFIDKYKDTYNLTNNQFKEVFDLINCKDRKPVSSKKGLNTFISEYMEEYRNL